MRYSVEVRGLREAQKKAEQLLRDVDGGSEILKAVRDSLMMVQRGAKKPPRMPVDTGRLRASITPSIVQIANSVQGIVGSNVEYAPYQELGTSRGVPARRFLAGAVEDAKDRIIRLIEAVFERIRKK